MGLDNLFSVEQGYSQPKPVDLRTWTLTNQPRTFEQWKEWVHELGLIIEPGIGLTFADEPLIEGHGVPIRWGYELYCQGCGRQADGSFEPMGPEELRDLLTDWVIKASRAGGKTLMVAIVGFTLCIWNDNYQWNHTAAVKEQCDRVWGYLRGRLLKDPIFEKQLAKKPTKTELNFINGSAANILTGTGEGQNSKHPQFQSFDEVELMDIDIIREGRLAAIRKRRPGGVDLPSLGVFISTQKKANETMFILIADAKRGEKNLVVSSVFDVMERCEDWRTDRLPPTVKCGDWDEITHRLAYLSADRNNSNVVQRQEQQRLEHSRDLLLKNCPIIADCKGCAKRACGWYGINDAIKKSKDKPYWRAQMLSKQPQMEHAIYEQFSEEENVTDEAEYNPDKPVLVFMDYGFMQDPTYICLAQGQGTYVTVFAECLLEHISAGKTPPELRKFLSIMGLTEDDIQEICPDPSASELREALEDDGFVVSVRRGKKARRVKYGIDKVAELVYNDGHRSLLIHSRCQMLIQNMLIYEKTLSGDPKARQWDHPVDGLRYGILWVVMQSRGGSSIIDPGRAVGKTTR